jgi:protein-tyrosine phosphatase
MVDIHSHILPKIDDGAKSWETAIEMVRMAYEDGIRHMAATPHADDEYAYDRSSCADLLATLKRDCGVEMEFSLGCDFHLSVENIESALRNPPLYCIGTTEYLLVEFSDYGISPFTGDALLALLRKGITPIITHPERNQILQQKLENVLGFAEHGCLIQVTANSLTGFWGDRARKSAQWLLDHECVHVIATDAHDLKRRPPILSEAHEWIAKHYSPALASALCEHNPGAIVRNEVLPYMPEHRHA